MNNEFYAFETDDRKIYFCFRCVILLLTTAFIISGFGDSVEIMARMFYSKKCLKVKDGSSF